MCNVPLTIGGGIRTIEDIRVRLSAGADKISINTAVIDDPSFIKTAANRFGSQCIVVSIDVKKENNDWRVYKNFGQVATSYSIDEWIKIVDQFGAGEILLQSIDRDGSGLGYDLELIKKVEKLTKKPIIVLGGVGDFSHFVDGCCANKNIALSAANIFHFTEQSILNAKKYLINKNINTRL